MVRKLPPSHSKPPTNASSLSYGASTSKVKTSKTNKMNQKANTKANGSSTGESSKQNRTLRAVLGGGGNKKGGGISTDRTRLQKTSTGVSSWRNRLKMSAQKSVAGNRSKNSNSGTKSAQTSSTKTSAKGNAEHHSIPNTKRSSGAEDDDDDKAVTTDADYVTNSGYESEDGAGSYNDTFFTDSDPEAVHDIEYEVATSVVSDDSSQEDLDDAERRASSEYPSNDKVNTPPVHASKATNKRGAKYQTKPKLDRNGLQSPETLQVGGPNNQLLFQKLWQDLTQLQNDSNGATEALAKKSKKLKALQTKATDLEHRRQQDRRRIERLLHRIAALEKANTSTNSQLKQSNQNLEAERKAHHQFVEETKVLRERSRIEYENVTSKLEQHQLKVKELTSRLDTMKAAEEEHIRMTAELQHTFSTQQQRHDDERERTDKTVSLMKKEVERLSLQKEEVSRHLWHTTDELKSIKEQFDKKVKELEQSKEANDKILESNVDQSKQLESLEKQLTASNNSVKKLQDAVKGSEQKADSKLKHLNDAVVKLNSDIESLNDIHNKDQIKIKELGDQIIEKDSDIKRINQEATTRAESLTRAASVLQENHLKEVVAMEAKLTELKAVVESSEASITKIKAECTEARRLHKLSASQFKQEKQKTKVLESELTQMKAEKQKLEETLQEHVSARSRTEAALNALQNVRDRDISAIKEELEQAKEKQKNLKGEQSAQIATLTETLEERDSTIKDMNQRLQDTCKDLDVIKGNYKSSKEGWLKLQNELEEQLKKALATATELQHDQSHELEEAVEKQAIMSKALETEKQERQRLLEDCRRMNAQIKAFGNERKQLTETIQSAQKKATMLSSQLDQVKGELTTSIEQLQEEQSKSKLTTAEHIAARKDLRELVEELKDELKETKKTAAMQVTAFQEKSENGKLELEELRKTRLELEQKLLLLEKKLHSKEKSYENLETELRELQSKFDKESHAMNRDLETAETKAQLAEQKLRELEAIQTNGHTLEHKLKELRTSLLERDRSLNQTQKELVQAQAQISDHMDAISNLRKEITVRKQDYQNVTSDLATVKADRSGLERECRVREARLNKELAEAKHQLQTKDGEIDRSRTLLEQLQVKFEKVQEAANTTVQKLMAEAQASEKQCAEDLSLLRAELREQGNRFLDMQNNRAKDTNNFRAQKALMDEQLATLQRQCDEVKAAKEEALQEVERKGNQLDATCGELEALQGVMQGLERRLTQNEGTISGLEEQLVAERKSRGELKKELKEEETLLRNQLDQEKELNNKLRSDLNASSREMEWAQNESSIKQSALTRQVANLRGDLQRKSEDLVATETKLQQAQEEMQLLHAATSKQIAQLKDDNRLSYDSHQKELESAKRDLQAFAAKMSQLESDLDTSRSRIRELQLKLDQQSDEAVAQSQAAEGLVRRIKTLDTSKRKLEGEVKKLRRQLESSSSQGTRVDDSNRIEGMERAHAAEVDQLQRKIEHLQQQLQSDQTTKKSIGNTSSGTEHNKFDEPEGDGGRRTSQQRLQAVEQVAQMYYNRTHQQTKSTQGHISKQSTPAHNNIEYVATSSHAQTLVDSPPPAPGSRGSNSSGGTQASSRSVDTMRRASEYLQRRRSSSTESISNSMSASRDLLPNNMTLGEADEVAAKLEDSAQDMQRRMSNGLSSHSTILPIPGNHNRAEGHVSRPGTASSIGSASKLPYVHHKGANG